MRVVCVRVVLTVSISMTNVETTSSVLEICMAYVVVRARVRVCVCECV